MEVEEINDTTTTNAEFKKFKSAKTVYIEAVFLKISDIDTVKEQFSATVFIQARWREPSLDHVKDNTTTDFSKFWNPKLVIQNVPGDLKMTPWKEVRKGKNGEAYIVEKRRVRGTFFEKMELHDFPFDIQDISVVVSTELGEEAVQFLEDDYEVSSINMQAFLDEQEWHLYDFVDSKEKTVQREYTEARFRNPGLLMRCAAARRWMFYWWNIILIMTLISSMSLTTWVVDRKLIPNRMQLSFILMLSAVAFRFVTMQSLPKIPYLTHLDKFILGNFSFMWMVALFHAVSFALVDTDDDRSSDLDFWSFVTFITLYLCMHVLFYIWVFVKHMLRRVEVGQRQEAYQEKAQKMMGESWKMKRRKEKHPFRRNTVDTRYN